MSHLLERAALAGVLIAALAACGGDHADATPTAKAEKSAAETWKPSPSVAASSSARASESEHAKGSAEAAEEPSAEASASAQAPIPIAVPGVSGIALPIAPASTPKATAATVQLPKAPNGILPRGGADKILKVGDKPSVRVLEPGTEPRGKLAYAITKGSEQKLEVVLEMAVGMKVGLEAMPPTRMPRMTMTLGLSASDKTDVGDAKILAKLAHVGIEANDPAEKQIADALRPQLESVKGLTMSYWVSPQGYVRDLKMEDSKFAGAGAQIVQGMTQSFESMVAKLPSDEVGQGARWQVVSRVSNSGADLLQFETYTLKKRDDSRLSLEVALTQLVANEAMSPPNLPPGATATISSFSSTGTGDTELDEKHVAAESGSVRMRTTMELSVKQTPTGVPESTRIETTMNVRYRKPK